MTNRVIDADGHICEPPAVWNDYVEKRHRADTIRVERDQDGRDWVSINGAMRRNLRPAAACVPWGMDDPNNVPTWRARQGAGGGRHRTLAALPVALPAGRRHRGSGGRGRDLPRLQRMDRRH